MERKWWMTGTVNRPLARAARSLPAWRDSDLGRLAERAANWLQYDQDVVALCREALRLGFTVVSSDRRVIQCAGYLHGEACSREAWETFWESKA